MAAEVTFTRVAPARARVEGRVTHANARSAWESTRTALAGILTEDGALLEIDLSGVTSGNSLVLSLMLSWLRQARAMEREIRFGGISPALSEQIRFTGLSSILRLDAEVKA